MDTIKCGRKVYGLVDGDTVMDNGSCLQFITRKVRKGWNELSPIVSKVAFEKFRKNENVWINNNHSYGDNVILHTYSKKNRK